MAYLSDLSKNTKKFLFTRNFFLPKIVKKDENNEEANQIPLNKRKLKKDLFKNVSQKKRKFFVTFK